MVVAIAIVILAEPVCLAQHLITTVSYGNTGNSIAASLDD